LIVCGVAARELGSANDVARMIAFRRLHRELLPTAVAGLAFISCEDIIVRHWRNRRFLIYAYMYLTWNE